MRIRILAALGLLFLLLGVLGAAERPRLLQRKAPPAVVAPMPAPAQGIFDGSLRKKLLMAIVRHHTVAKLVKDGLKGKKLTRAEAEAAFDSLAKTHPELVDGAIAEASPMVSGQLAGGRLTDFLQWLSDHSAEIMRIVELLVKILSLFG